MSHFSLIYIFQERRKDLVDHRDDSTFSFDPASLDVKQLDKNNKKKIDSKKGVLLSSYTRKKTKRRKGRVKEGNNDNSNNELNVKKQVTNTNDQQSNLNTQTPVSRPTVLELDNSNNQSEKESLMQSTTTATTVQQTEAVSGMISMVKNN